MDEQSVANEQRATFIADAFLSRDRVFSEGVGYDAGEVRQIKEEGLEMIECQNQTDLEK
ncbi:MAG TPA: hypothetical protein PK225_04050 [Azonexus sp.]|jgi:hypothetical protein|nr:hypothetical protein [Azonexus sp.]